MIQINCNNCKALLQIDDAFAGGVCRCRYCGTIQTVPKHLKQSANGEQATVAAGATAKAGGKAKTLYRTKTGPRGDPLPGSGSGLDELANIVASSGLSSARLKKSPEQPAEPASDAPRGIDRKTLTIVTGAGGVIVLLLGIIIIMALRDKNGTGTATGSGTGSSAGGGGPNPSAVVAPAAANSVPKFLGQSLEPYDTVVFILDRGAGTIEEGRLEMSKEAVARTLGNFGEDRLFRVVFWELEGSAWSFPKDAVAPANKPNLEQFWNEVKDVTGRGLTKVDKAAKKAFDSKPDAIVLIAVKSYLDDEFVQAVKKARGSSGAKVYTFSLWQSGLAPQLKQIADETGGKYRDVTLNELREAAGR